MYSHSYLISIKKINNILNNIIERHHNLQNKKARDKLGEVLNVLNDFSTLLSNISFTLPNEPTECSSLVGRCIKEIYNDREIKIHKLEAEERTELRQSELFEVINDYVLIPLSNKGKVASNWIPLIETLHEFTLSADNKMKIIMPRVKTDCDDFITSIWSALRNGIEIILLEVSTVAEANKAISNIDTTKGNIIE